MPKADYMAELVLEQTAPRRPTVTAFAVQGALGAVDDDGAGDELGFSVTIRSPDWRRLCRRKGIGHVGPAWR